MHHEPPVEQSITLEALASISELEQNASSHVQQQREHGRIQTRCKVLVCPGNSSQRSTRTIHTISGDISAGGCLLLSPSTLLVGDIYWLTFDAQTLPIDPVFARCVRCRLVREDTFEAGFRFFHQIFLPKSLHGGPDDLLD
jgi:hypothetical protein